MMKNLINILTKKGYEKLVIKVKAQEPTSQAYGTANVLRLLAHHLLDNTENLSRKYSLLIDESSIRGHGCTFIISDEDGNTHGRLIAEIMMTQGHEEITYEWRSLKAAEDFENPELQRALESFLKKNDMVFDFIYYEGPHERVGDIVSVMQKEVRTYANNLVAHVKKYLR